MSEAAASLPVIDFSRFLLGDTQQRKAVSDEIWDQLEKFGFLYLKECDSVIPNEVVKQMFACSKDFFSLSPEEKNKLAWQSPESNRGYSAPGREKTSRLDKGDVEALRNKAPDLKETFEIGKEPSDGYQNNWPDAKPEMQGQAMDFFGRCHQLHLEIMSALALALNLPVNFFQSSCSKRDHNLRLLWYPPAPKKLFENVDQARAGTHTDYGTLTLLFQDQAGGLEVLAPDGKSYLKATPIPGTIVINAGDLLSRWTNDKIRSTEHRVVAPPTEPNDENYPQRQSIAAFHNPDWDALIEALPGTFNEKDNPAKYPPIKAHDYLVQRLKATY